jgi:hypothetical protein
MAHQIRRFLMSVVKVIGKTNALTAITRILPGHADPLRQTLQHLTDAGGGKIAELGTIHIVRWVIFDEGTRLLFATNFVGEVEDYSYCNGYSIEVFCP